MIELIEGVKYAVQPETIYFIEKYWWIILIFSFVLSPTKLFWDALFRKRINKEIRSEINASILPLLSKIESSIENNNKEMAKNTALTTSSARIILIDVMDKIEAGDYTDETFEAFINLAKDYIANKGNGLVKTRAQRIKRLYMERAYERNDEKP